MARYYTCRLMNFYTYLPSGLLLILCLVLGGASVWCKASILPRAEDIKLILSSPNPILISTGPFDCTAVVPCTQAGLATLGVTINSPCFLSNIGVRLERWGQQVKGFEINTDRWFLVNKVAEKGNFIGIETGHYRMILDLMDGCANRGRDTFEFFVEDRIAPVMKCNKGFNLGWSSYANESATYARIDVLDLDEGSSDNCGLQWIRIRRNYQSSCEANFIDKGYDYDENGRIEVGKDGFDRNGDGDINDFGEAFERVNGMIMTPLQDYIELFCCDIGNTLTFELWGQDWKGNRNFCWTSKKLEPQCNVKSNLTLFSDDPRLAVIDDFEAASIAFGDQFSWHGITCSNVKLGYQVEKKLKCGYGTIVRSWTIDNADVPGGSSPLCSQTILVRPRRNYAILFPADKRSDCLIPAVDSLMIRSSSCDLLAVTVVDKQYDRTGAECYKIFRTYTVVNWCAYDEKKCGSPDNPNTLYNIDRRWSGYGLFPLYLLVLTEGEAGEESFYLSRNQTPGEGNLHDLNVTEKNDESIQPVFCQAALQYLHAFRYTQVIMVYDEQAPKVNIPPTSVFCMNDPAKCVADIQVNFSAKDDCPFPVFLDLRSVQIALNQTKDSSSYFPALFFDPNWQLTRYAVRKDSFAIAIKNVPEGIHDLLFQVVDKCGNNSTLVRIPFVIKDCVIARPICLNSLKVNMGANTPQGATRILATDFIAAPIFDCNGQGTETKNGLAKVTNYSINRQGIAKNQNQKEFLVDCSALGKPIIVEIHAWDAVGNTDSCFSILILEDPFKACQTSGNFDGKIFGKIATELKYPVEGVEIALKGNVQSKSLTDSKGKFGFISLQNKADYNIKPSLDVDFLKGVSTFDLVIIQNHLFGVQVINSPYKLIAADVNNSKSITTLDLIMLRKLILNLTDRFESNTSWRFIDANYNFPNPANPWMEDFPEQVNVISLLDSAAANFVAVKIGDVNGSAGLPEIGEIRSSSQGTWPIHTLDKWMEAGEEHRISFKAKETNDLLGFQFALRLDPRQVRLLDIDYGLAQKENVETDTERGLVAVSWNRPPVFAPTDSLLFSLRLKVLSSGQLRDAVSFSPRYLEGEAYLHENEKRPVVLNFDKKSDLDYPTGELQNFPNPFEEETQLRFFLPNAAEVNVIVSDLSGKICHQSHISGQENWNQITLKTNENWTAGVLFCTLETPFYTETKKMIFIKN